MKTKEEPTTGMDAAFASEIETAQPVSADPVSATEDVIEGPASAERRGNVILLKNGATLPKEICVKTGRPAHRVVEQSLRDPMNPTTWFGKREKLRLGLSRKAYENLMIARAITWAGIAVAAMILISGIVQLNLVMILVGLLVAVAASPARAIFPVWGKSNEDLHEVEVHGVGEGFLSQISWR